MREIWKKVKNGILFTIGCICMLVIFGVLFYLSDTLEDEYNVHGIMKGLILAIPLALLCLSPFMTGKYIGQNKSLMKWITFIGMIVVTAVLLINGMVHSIKVLLPLNCDKTER